VRSLGALAAVVLLAGCGADPPEKVGAERAVARQAHAESADCTSRSRILFKEGPPANVFICAVKLGNGLCDVYRVERRGVNYRARVLERHGGCTLPAG
jgi:hypothetical protein